jgi:hypothetical protein
VNEEARACRVRGGEICEETSSALPSRDKESRTCEDNGGCAFDAEIISEYEGDCFELSELIS